MFLLHGAFFLATCLLTPGNDRGSTPHSIDLFGDIFLRCKWLNTRVILVFIRSINLIEIAVKSNGNILSMPYFFRNRISNLVQNFYRVYERIDKISEMNTRLIRTFNINSKKVYWLIKSISFPCFAVHRTWTRSRLSFKTVLLLTTIQLNISVTLIWMIRCVQYLIITSIITSHLESFYRHN